MFAGGRDRRGSTIQSLTVPDRENCMYKSTETESCLGRTETQLEGFDLKERGVAGEVSKAEWTIIRSLIFFFPAYNGSRRRVFGRRVTERIFGLQSSPWLPYGEYLEGGKWERWL